MHKRMIPPSPKRANSTVEWVRPGKLEQRFGITRTMVYLLATRGEIELVSLKPPGASRGLALVNVDSVRSFIERRRAASASTSNRD